MKIIGYKKGKTYVLTTNDPKKLEAFADTMERTEYLYTKER